MVAHIRATVLTNVEHETDSRVSTQQRIHRLYLKISLNYSVREK